MTKQIPTEFVAIDPRTGCHVRPATETEIRWYRDMNPGTAFDAPVRVGDFLIDTYHGPGQRHL